MSDDLTLTEAPAMEWRRLTLLKRYPKNAKKHSPEQVKQIAASITEFGFTFPLLIDEADGIEAGHGRELAAALIYKRGGSIVMAGGMAVPHGCVPVIVARGWTETQKRAYVLADNKLTENGEWDEALLKAELLALKVADFNLETAGFINEDLVVFLAGAGGEGGDGENKDGDREGTRGELLALVNITIADPTHKVVDGDHYVLGGRHHLLCGSVMTDWPKWNGLLIEGAIFCPYPGPFVPFGAKVAKHPLVMVTPDTYTAGHILDRYAEVNGESAVVKLAPTVAA
jgi:hypothetical protein